MMSTRPLALVVVVLAALASSVALMAQETQTVRVPDGNGTPILTDGRFSPGEWDDALTIDVRPNIQLLLKKHAGYVFIGVRYDTFPLAAVNLFISPDGKAIHELHVSAQLGERLLNETPGLDDDPPFVWGDTTGWYANEIRWNAGKAQDLVKQGKSVGEAQIASLYAYDGFEFQIRQSKFGSEAWLVRLESLGQRPVVYPEGTDPTSTRGWLRLALE